MSYFLMMIVIGFAYVNKAFLYGIRTDCFYSAREEFSVFNPYSIKYRRYHQNLKTENYNFWKQYYDLKAALLVGLLLYYTSAISIFRHKKSRTGGVCIANNEFQECYLREELGNWEVFKCNITWTLFYFVGLQWSHLSMIDGMRKFTI